MGQQRQIAPRRLPVSLAENRGVGVAFPFSGVVQPALTVLLLGRVTGAMQSVAARMDDMQALLDQFTVDGCGAASGRSDTAPTAATHSDD